MHFVNVMLARVRGHFSEPAPPSHVTEQPVIESVVLSIVVIFAFWMAL